MIKCITFLLLITTTNYSQVYVSPKFGVVLSNPIGHEYNVHDEQSKNTIYVGAEIEYKLKENYSLFFEVNRSDKGVIGKRDLLMNFGYNPYELDINMLNFYIGGKYRLYKKHSVKAGAYYGYVLSVIETYSNEKTGRDLGIRDISNVYEKSDYGLMLGLEFVIVKGLFAELTYVRGFGDIRQDIGTGLQQPSIKTQIFSASIGYKFKIGGS